MYIVFGNLLWCNNTVMVALTNSYTILERSSLSHACSLSTYQSPMQLQGQVCPVHAVHGQYLATYCMYTN